jgi:DNA-directed RNA polymerase specialized sigma24 family protein
MMNRSDDAADAGPPSAISQSFDLLLARLGPGSEGALGYERLRVRLVAFFRVRFPAQSEALADEAIDRLARRLAEGTVIDNLTGYAHGIGRLLLLEESNRQERARLAADETLRDLANPDETQPDPALPILKDCLKSLGSESADFILSYYAGDGGATRIERRQRLADSSGVSLNALRNRALRIRLALEKCVRVRLQQDISDS